MTSSTVTSGLTPEDRVLLRSVFAWARSSGWRRVSPDYDGPSLKDLRDWHWFGPDREVFLEVLTFPRSAPDWRFVVSSTAAEGVEIRADGSLDVRRCVDVLVALGVLPAHLSSAYAAGRESALHEPNDIEATGECCCNGCIGMGRCDLYDPAAADERAENDAERFAEMTAEERDSYGDL